MWQTLFQKRLLIFLGLAFLLITWAIFLTSSGERKGEVLPEWITKGILRPFQGIVGSVSRSFVETWQTLNHLGALHRENYELKTEITRLEMENKRLRMLAQENARLRQALNFRDRSHLELLPAEVIAHSPHHWTRTLTIDKGSRHGLRRNMAVITPDGLAGRILSVSSNRAEVLLINDGRDGNKISGILERTRDLVYISGAGGYCIVTPSDIGVTLRPGDRILTAESSLVFPPNLTIGVIVDVKRSGAGQKGEALLKPAVASSRLEELFVVLRPLSQPETRRSP
ncbi:MAG TPA: rod shape-determining protein MreC [Firmicutes bacterium]|nr:rod shape-determining protein MreC [Bacillota bacterium]HOQ24015.1 rod shape-determining protein MreC [Bacillota bacterium]HPT67413.1 rod shape-determining protein MreC [Bacillota bacterium]